MRGFAFEEIHQPKLKTKEKPGVLEQLNKLKELVAAILPDKGSPQKSGA